MLNRIDLIGHLGVKPEIKELNGGNRVAKFSLAVSKRFKDGNGERSEKTTWFSCEVWNKLADVADKYLEKGSKVYLEGEMVVEKWESEGEEKIKYVVRVAKLVMLDGKKDSTGL